MKISFFKFILFISVTFIFATNSSGQTVGLTQIEENSIEGYTFFSPFSGTKAWMVDNCGRLVNEWDRGTRPGLSAYFLENGNLFRTYKADLVGPFTSASNAGGIELVDWNNNVVWSYEINTETQLSHHDAVYMPNGNILILTWELVFEEEIIDLGRNPNEIAEEGFMWSEKILELEPVGNNDANIVWQWEIKHHYIQDFDPTKVGFGVVADHPELFNINLPDLNSSNSNATRDWNHFNAIDYNEELDQILISVRNSDEIWILDHSTTTEEAASHSGGRYGKGGDLLYRWGNASAYDRAAISDQKLFGQHGVNWIKDGLEDAGKILIYNNGNGRPGTDYSTIEILDPPQDTNGGYMIENDQPFAPIASEIVYGDTNEEEFYSPYLSNAQRLTNGNTLINVGSRGYIMEVDTDRNIVWNYVIPLFGDFPATQGNSVNNNSNFRAYKYASDYEGFEGVELNATETIEIGGNPLACMLTTVKTEINPAFSMQYHSVNNQIEYQNLDNIHQSMILCNTKGQVIQRYRLNNIEGVLNLPILPKGMYFLSSMNTKKQITSFKFAIF